jgi:hypothetical protein
MVAFIDAHRAQYGVESICAQLPIAPAAYYTHKLQQRDPSRQCARRHPDGQLAGHDNVLLSIREIADDNLRPLPADSPRGG